MPFKIIELALPDVILCLNGLLPHTSVFEQLAPIPIVAADGAANQLQNKGLLPHHIIGDLDSISKNLGYWEQQKKINIVEVAEQNSTDFEKSLEYIHHKGYSSSLICGLHGGEFDHTLNNWSILMRYGKSMRLAAYEEDRFAMPVYESVRFSTTPGEMISLIPQPSVCLTTDGLEWNLQKEELALGIREGARNRATKEIVTLEIHSGSLLLFQTAFLPYIPQIKFQEAK
ncbi:MAG: thiamine diphosphokinase [Ignavibacteria bacterium]|nr:thiamine diphosphokinase [Ignavibacteria bacterium]